MSRAMNMTELTALYEEIMRHHSPMCGASASNVKVVKYIDPHIDMRDGKVFAISFRMFGGTDHTMHTQNECRDLPDSLFQRCLTWLKTPAF
jgi:hypothetical protein